MMTTTPIIDSELCQMTLPQLAAAIQEEHVQAEAAARASLVHARQAGDLLLQAKSKVAHGNWLPWLAEHCPIPERTCQAYMRIASRWDEIDKSATVADLTLRDGLKLLAKPKAATTFEDSICDKLEQAVQLLAEVRAEAEDPIVDDVAAASCAERVRLAQEIIDDAHAVNVDALAALGECLRAPDA